ncbi:hypothetical protein Taro_013430, partial [Colocasia esculenta]|nr:hypothetical protein [Colocasia esculenta]
WLMGARGKTLVREAELDRAENSGSGGNFCEEASKGSTRIEVCWGWFSCWRLKKSTSWDDDVDLFREELVSEPDLLWLQGGGVSGEWLCRHLSRRLEMPRYHHWLSLDLRTRTVRRKLAFCRPRCRLEQRRLSQVGASRVALVKPHRESYPTDRLCVSGNEDLCGRPCSSPLVCVEVDKRVVAGLWYYSYGVVYFPCYCVSDDAVMLRWLTGARGKTLVREAELDRAENSGSGSNFRKEASKGSARIEVWQDFLHALELGLVQLLETEEVNVKG